MRKEHRSWLVVATVTALVVFLGMRTLGTATQAQEKRIRPQQFMWIPIKAQGTPAPLLKVYRANVPGGWLVLVQDKAEKGRDRGNGYGYGVGVGSGVTFVPDPEHKWRTP